jgi:hypothetical protein
MTAFRVSGNDSEDQAQSMATRTACSSLTPKQDFLGIVESDLCVPSNGIFSPDRWLKDRVAKSGLAHGWASRY